MDYFFYSAINILRYVGTEATQLFPYVLAGSVLGELLKLTSWTFIVSSFGRKFPTGSLLIVSLIGMASPICTFGTVPFVINMYKSGLPIRIAVSFLVSSTLMNPQLFLYTWGGISHKMALLRVATGLTAAVLAGYIAGIFPEEKIINKDIRLNLHKEKCEKYKTKSIKETAAGIYNNLLFVSYYMLIGMFISAFVNEFVPTQLITSVFSGEGIASVIVSAIMGIPLYACGGGVIPFVKELINSGMGEGAALAFLLTGPATRISALASLSGIMKTQAVVSYVLFILIIAIFAGIII